MMSYTETSGAAWGPGPWAAEPNRLTFIDEDTKLEIFLLRNHFGAWCGYVEVPERCKLYKLDQTSQEVEELSVHGGITYSGYKKEGKYFLGFDCCHAGDLAPGLSIGDGEYRTLEYAKAQAKNLALQIFNISKGATACSR